MIPIKTQTIASMSFAMAIAEFLTISDYQRFFEQEAIKIAFPTKHKKYWTLLKDKPIREVVEILIGQHGEYDGVNKLLSILKCRKAGGDKNWNLSQLYLSSDFSFENLEPTEDDFVSVFGETKGEEEYFNYVEIGGDIGRWANMCWGDRGIGFVPLIERLDSNSVLQTL